MMVTGGVAFLGVNMPLLHALLTPRLLACSLAVPPELFYISKSVYKNKTEAQAACAQQGASLAFLAHVKDGFSKGAQVCFWGYVGDDAPNGTIVAFPMQEPRQNCSTSAGVQQDVASNMNNGMAGAACFGVKPPRGTADIAPWNDVTNSWSVRDFGEPIHRLAVLGLQGAQLSTQCATPYQCCVAPLCVH